MRKRAPIQQSAAAVKMSTIVDKQPTAQATISVGFDALEARLQAALANVRDVQATRQRNEQRASRRAEAKAAFAAEQKPVEMPLDGTRPGYGVSPIWLFLEDVEGDAPKPTKRAKAKSGVLAQHSTSAVAAPAPSAAPPSVILRSVAPMPRPPRASLIAGIRALNPATAKRSKREAAAVL